MHVRVEAHGNPSRALSTVVLTMNFIPQERFRELKPALQDQLAKMARVIGSEDFSDLCDPLVSRFLERTFAAVRATEGSIWLLDQEKRNLVIAYNSGPNAGQLIGFAQPLSKGLVSATFATEQALIENEVYKNAEHDHELNRLLKQTTYAMIVVPFYFLNERRGVITCVQLIDVYLEADQFIPVGSTPPGFNRNDLITIQDGASILRDLIDFRLLRETLGWGSS
jgi:hypothetical protein